MRISRRPGRPSALKQLQLGAPQAEGPASAKAWWWPAVTPLWWHIRGLSRKPALRGGRAGPRVELGCRAGTTVSLWARALGATSGPIFSGKN